MKKTKKKPIIYVSIHVGLIVITLLVSYVTGVDTSNTWLGALYANAFGLAITIMLFDIAKSVRTPRALTRYIVYFFPLLMLIGIVLSNIIFIMGAFN